MACHAESEISIETYDVSLIIVEANQFSKLKEDQGCYD